MLQVIGKIDGGPEFPATWHNQKQFTGYCRLMGATEEQIQFFCRSGRILFNCETPGPHNSINKTRYYYRID